MANKQTAVEWYDAQLKEIDFKLQSGLINFEQCKALMSEAFDKAKAMEKEQITNAYSNGRVDEQFKGTNASFYRKTSEQYYNETFKSE